MPSYAPKKLPKLFSWLQRYCYIPRTYHLDALWMRKSTFSEGQITRVIFPFLKLKRLSIWRRVVKELLKGINVPYGTFDAQYDIEKTSTWLLGGQRIFYAKVATLEHLHFTLHILSSLT